MEYKTTPAQNTTDRISGPQDTQAGGVSGPDEPSTRRPEDQEADPMEIGVPLVGLGEVRMTARWERLPGFEWDGDPA